MAIVMKGAHAMTKAADVAMTIENDDVAHGIMVRKTKVALTGKGVNDDDMKSIEAVMGVETGTENMETRNNGTIEAEPECCAPTDRIT